MQTVEQLRIECQKKVSNSQHDETELLQDILVEEMMQTVLLTQIRDNLLVKPGSIVSKATVVIGTPVNQK